MTTRIQSPEDQADQSSDRMAYAVAAGILFLSWVIISSTVQLEALRAGRDIDWREPWLSEFTSHITLLGIILIIPLLLTKFPLSLETWKRRLPVYIVGFCVYTILHVFMMVALRVIIYPAVLGQDYHFGLLDSVNWLYEARKDLFSFVLFLYGFLVSRQTGQLKLEARAEGEHARKTHKITLKSGGRTIFLDADEIVWAKSASNYVEVHTGGKTHLARLTMARLQVLLDEAESCHTRCHRSYIVNRAHIREIIPTGEGDAKLILINGDVIPASRRYRNQLE